MYDALYMAAVWTSTEVITKLTEWQIVKMVHVVTVQDRN